MHAYFWAVKFKTCVQANMDSTDYCDRYCLFQGFRRRIITGGKQKSSSGDSWASGSSLQRAQAKGLEQIGREMCILDEDDKAF